MPIFKVDLSNPNPAVVAEIAGLLKSGAVIAFPTDTFYGLGADIYNDNAVQRIFEIKGRTHDKPILVLISDREGLMPLISTKNIPPFAERLMDEFWPGPLTMVFHASSIIPEVLTSATGKIGIRLPDHIFCRTLIEKLGRPITATSANISGMRSLDNPSDVLDSMGDRIDALIDGGVTQGGCESTVIDVTGDEPVILREGALPVSYIKAVLSGDRS